MRKVTLEELKKIALDSKDNLWSDAQTVGRDVKIYLHWSAGRYSQFFNDYHVSVDGEGYVYVSTDDLSETKSHTWRRNTGAIGIVLNCCYNATSNDLGEYPPTNLQIESIAQVVAALSKALDLTIDKEHIMTHAEAADLDGYGPGSGDSQTRWDLLFLHNGDQWGTGGQILRGKAIFYANN
jgi:hypothetical protein